MDQEIVSKNEIVSQLIKVGHRDFSVYSTVGLKAVKNEPDLFAHLIAWNTKNGEVRDSKAALPVIALRGEYDEELFENAVANLCKLDVRGFLRATEFNRSDSIPPVTTGGGTLMKDAVKAYIRYLEEDRGRWNAVAVQHRSGLKRLYAMNHIAPNPWAQKILFDGERPKGTVFEAIKNLKLMTPKEAAGTILNYKIPFLIAVGEIGAHKDKTDIILALIEGMTGAELITNTAMLKKYGVFENPALKSSYDAAVKRAKDDKRVSSMKAGKAAEIIGDKKASEKLTQIQEDKIDQNRIDGDWLVLGDRSGSMSACIEVARNVAATLARSVKGKVHLVFFNTMPTYVDVTGKTLQEIKDMTKRMNAGGGTSIGCGLDYIASKGILVDGIAICSDGGDNSTPYFHQAYEKYQNKFGVDPTVYLYHVPGETNRLINYMPRGSVEVFSLVKGRINFYDTPDIDYYGLPNLVKTMRANRYSLLDEIMESKLLRFADVFGWGKPGRV